MSRGYAYFHGRRNLKGLLTKFNVTPEQVAVS